MAAVIQQHTERMGRRGWPRGGMAEKGMAERGMDEPRIYLCIDILFIDILCGTDVALFQEDV